ncbi:MAG: PAS domain-containing protein [Chloroflexi bacterium]|nr:PAS domain-containing protein [Chloroflexota bacterium]
MTDQLSAYVLLLFVSSGICGIVARIAWQRRTMPGGMPLVFLLLGAAIWSLSVALETLTPDIPGKVFWSKIEYLGVATEGTFYFLFAAQYTHLDRWLTRRATFLLAIVPALTFLIAATNEWHQWLWNSFTFDFSSGDTLLIYGHAFWFWVNVAYNYALAFISTILLIRFVIRSPRLYRQQALAMLIAAFAPLTASAIYVFGWSPLPTLDLSPFMFALTGLALAWAVTRYRLLDLVPIARDRLIEKMSDGVLVFDRQHRVVDVNPVAQTILGRERALIGERVEQIDARLTAQSDRAETRAELALDGTPARYLEMRATPLFDQRNQMAGHLIILSDITPRKQMEFALHEMNSKLEQLVAGRTAELQQTVAELQNEIAERKQVETKLRQMEEVLAQRVADQSLKLSALYELILFAGQSLTVPEIQEQALATIMLVMGSDAGCIHLWNEKSRTLQLAAQRGLATAQQSQLGTLPAEWLLNDRIPRAVTDLSANTQLPAELRMPNWQSYLGIPTFLLGKPTGALSLFWKRTRSFPVEDIALFSAMADQVSIVVENVRLRQRSEAAAVQQERRRLARDLHDSVTQSLHSLVLSADTANHRLRQNKLDRLGASLGQLAESARQALKEMRLLLYELRLATLDQVNLIDALQLRLDAVERRAGIDAQLVVENLSFVPQVWEGELYCIAMEALNNSLKHARATQVRVQLRGLPNGIVLDIADNGQGIAPTTANSGGMGLRNMRERAERLGGTLVIDSTTGNGMRIHFAIRETNA